MNDILIIKTFRKNLLILFLLPILLLCIIFIQYGAVFDQYFKVGLNENNFSLISQLNIFNSKVKLPGIVKSIGSITCILLFALYTCWLLSMFLNSYYSLAINEFSKIGFIVELILFLLVTIFFILPGLNALISSLIIIFLLLEIAMIVLYLIYYKKIVNEKK